MGKWDNESALVGVMGFGDFDLVHLLGISAVPSPWGASLIHSE